ncbi:glycoside hydrolase superfamily, partial [Gorgonomyces haynaldii]
MFWWLVIILLPVAVVVGYILLVHRNMGSLPYTTEELAFDHDTFGHLISWTKHSILIHGKPTVLVSGEFHYWRVPDHTRWRQVLSQYKEAGLNCIRIYFSWSYHSPDKGIYDFTGNRDLDHLLTLCEELQMFVLVAPGPYICAETQAGGIPSWVLRNRDIRIRHSVNSFFKSYDDQYNEHCKEWFEHICPIFAMHQITTKSNGCVIGFQIENENFETYLNIPTGLHDDMRFLCKVVRDLQITVPLFTNDAWENASFITRSSDHHFFGKQGFGVDLYGFDKYLCFGPNSNPVSLEKIAKNKGDEWPEWEPKTIIKGLDNTEQKVRGFGGGAAQSPIMIPELQGGWFNHYTCKEGYDKVYDFYGEHYTRLIFETSLAQGVTIMNFYMFYGGTNWGTLGDPDVYTSYDYSACIREYGHLSGRARQLRLSISCVRSFMKYFAQTEPIKTVIRPAFKITSSLDTFISGHRKSLVENVEFVFFRNFNKLKRQACTLTLGRVGKEPVQLITKLGYKRSFIGIGSYTPKTGPRLLLATIPIYVKTTLNDEELWVVQCDDEISGQLAFYGPVETKGSLEPLVRVDGDLSIVSFAKSSGFCRIAVAGSEKHLNILALTGDDLYTLHPTFEEDYWYKFTTKQTTEDPLHVFWGVYQTQFDPKTKNLEIGQLQQSHLYQLDPKSENLVQSLALQEPLQIAEDPTLSFHSKTELDFSLVPWQRLSVQKTRPLQNTIDYSFLSGHVLYKLVFESEKETVFRINLRHRGTVFVNSKLLGGHLTYSLELYKPGSKAGPDKLSGGHHKYVIPQEMLRKGENELVVIVESFGLNRCPFTINDSRNPRGIIEVKSDSVPHNKIQWFIAGVDIRTLSMPFNHTGIPDQEHKTAIQEEGKAVKIPVENPVWYDGSFEYHSETKAPLRLHLEGNATAYVFFNGFLLARYYGYQEGPQRDFLLPEGFILQKN